ncbi:polyprenyl synthetase family protein [Bacteroidota bacterium]
MYTFEECQEVINKALNNIDLKEDPINLFTPIEYILSIGGKRIRPAMVLMTCNVFSDSIEDSINAALAIEIFHNFTLLHDDIMDNAEIRRGRQTVHEKWNANTAILSGDAMCILAYDILLKSKSELKDIILPIFNHAAFDTCKGQQLDIDFENRNKVSIKEYIEMISLKTSSLLAASMKIGALAGTASETDAQYFYEFGKNIGISFQLQDDLLDAFGDEKAFGKKNGGDIVANKKTFLLIKALELAQGEDYKILTNIISSQGLDPEEKISLVLEIYEKLNIKQITQEQINFYFNEAMTHINKIEINSAKIEPILAFTNNLMNRKS